MDTLEEWTGSDVTDPSIILDKRENAFIKKHVPREIKRLRFNELEITPKLSEEFKRMWLDGTLVKVIVEHFNLKSKSTVYVWAEKLGLEYRRHLRYENKSKILNCKFSPEEHKAIMEKAMSRGTTASIYLRNLVIRDIGGTRGVAIISQKKRKKP